MYLITLSGNKINVNDYSLLKYLQCNQLLLKLIVPNSDYV